MTMAAKNKNTKREVEWNVEVDNLVWWTVWDSCPTRREAVEIAKGLIAKGLSRGARIVKVTREVVKAVKP